MRFPVRSAAGVWAYRIRTVRLRRFCFWDRPASANADKMRIAKRAKELNLDAIHDTVHEMAKDEARHGQGFQGLYNRHFKK